MLTIELPAGEAVQIGPYVLQVLAVQPGRVVVALVDPQKDCSQCGRTLVEGRCPACSADSDQRAATVREQG